MSRIATISIEFEAILAKARQEYNEFKREVESNPIKAQISAGPGSGTGQNAPGATTFSGASGVAPGGTFVPPPTIGAVGGTNYAQMPKTFNFSQPEQEVVNAAMAASRYNLAQQHASQKEMINSGIAASRFNLAQQARVDNDWTFANLAQQKQDESFISKSAQDASNLQMSINRKAEVAEQKSVNASERAEKAWALKSARAASRELDADDSREASWAMRSFRAGRSKMNAIDDAHEEALQMNMQRDLQRLPGPAQQNGYNNLGSSSSRGGGEDTSNYAFGFIRPLAAAYIAYHGVSAMANTLLESRVREPHQSARLNTYSSLSEQIDANYGLAQSQEGTVGSYVGYVLNNGRFSGTGRGSRYAQSGDAELLAQARQTQAGFEASDVQLRSSRALNRETSLIGKTGFGAEYAGIAADYQTKSEDLAAMGRKFGTSAIPGFSTMQGALDRNMKAKQNDVLLRVNESLASGTQSVMGLQAAGEGRFFDSEQMGLKSKQTDEMNAAVRSVRGLPKSMATMILGQIVASHQGQTAALNYSQNLSVDMSIARNIASTGAAMYNRQGYAQLSAQSEVESKFLPMRDSSGNITGFMGMDKSALGQKEFDSRLDLYKEAQKGAYFEVAKNERRLENLSNTSWLRGSRQDFRAIREGIQGDFEAETQGMAIGSPKWVALDKLRGARLNEANLGESDWRERVNVGQMSEKRAFERGLKMDTVGQALEQLTGNYEMRLQDLKGPEKTKERIAELQNERLAVQLFQQQYALSFRGEALDTRRFAFNNPRDVQDPSEVFKQFGEKLDVINESLKELGSD